MKYSVEDIDEDFVREAVEDIKKKYMQHLESLRNFDKKLEANFTPIQKYDPVWEKKREFSFPLAFDIWNVYYYITTDTTNSDDINVESSLKSVEELFFHNPLYSEMEFNIRKDSFYNKRFGYLHHLAKLKKRLLNNDTFSAREVGIMIGYTNQGVISKIKATPEITPKKERGRYIFPNNTARRMVKNSKSPLLK